MVYCAATWCTVLQHVVLRCNMLQQVSLSMSVDGTPHTIRFLDSLELAVMDRAGKLIWWSHIATQHTMLQHSAACCNTAQHSTTVQQSTPRCHKVHHAGTHRVGGGVSTDLPVEAHAVRLPGVPLAARGMARLDLGLHERTAAVRCIHRLAYQVDSEAPGRSKPAAQAAAVRHI